MGTAIYAQCQAADDQRLFIQIAEAADQPAAAFAAVPGGFAGAYDGKRTFGVQVGRPLAIEHQRGVVAGREAAGVSGVVKGEQADAFGRRPGDFFRGPVEQRGSEEFIEQFIGVVQAGGNFFSAGLEDSGGTAEGVQQLPADGTLVREDFAQRTLTDKLIGLHIFFFARYEARPALIRQKSNS